MGSQEIHFPHRSPFASGSTSWQQNLKKKKIFRILYAKVTGSQSVCPLRSYWNKRDRMSVYLSVQKQIKTIGLNQFLLLMKDWSRSGLRLYMLCIGEVKKAPMSKICPIKLTFIIYLSRSCNNRN